MGDHKSNRLVEIDALRGLAAMRWIRSCYHKRTDTNQ